MAYGTLLSHNCATRPKKKRPETLRESGRYIWWAGVPVISYSTY